jgi:hypothetical protein
MTTKSKTAYTPEQTQELIELWDNGKGQTVEQLAKHFGKPNASVIAKLSRLEIYVKPEKTPEEKTATFRKDSLATEISNLVEMDENAADSLTKVNKSALLAILDALKSMQIDLDEYDESDESDDQPTSV